MMCMFCTRMPCLHRTLYPRIVGAVSSPFLASGHQSERTFACAFHKLVVPIAPKIACRMALWTPHMSGSRIGDACGSDQRIVSDAANHRTIIAS